MNKIVKTEETIQDEEAIMRHIPRKNEPGTSVDPGAEEVTVKLENQDNLITSFWSLTKDTTFKTKHSLLNHNLIKVKDEIMQFIVGYTQLKSHLSVKHVESHSLRIVTLQFIVGYTRVKSHLSVKYAESHLLRMLIQHNIVRYTQMISLNQNHCL